MVVSNAVCTMPLTLQDSTTPCEQRNSLSREKEREREGGREDGRVKRRKRRNEGEVRVGVCV